MNQDIDPVEEFKRKLKKDSSQYRVFQLLSDLKWHCRTCEGKRVASDQYAGGGGIQGLERGTKTRSGLVIKTKKDNCPTCNKKTTWDRWTGEMQAANAPTNIPKDLAKRILEFYKFKDVIENRQRESHELIIDRRFPMERWGQSEAKHNINMTEIEIEEKFQLLKKDMAGNNNLLKSRSCEICIKTGKRGTPMGIRFWYSGGENWEEGIPPKGKDAEQGCIGCGWYNFEEWRNSLNKKLVEFQVKDLDSSAEIESK
jgi:hypothetical protein